MTKTEAFHPSGPGSEEVSVICDLSDRLDPRRLERAVGLLVGARPELAGSSTGTAAPGTFVHLDLSTAPAPERPSAEDAVLWVLRRCFDRSEGRPFVVTYVDTGSEEPGRLVLAGNRSAVADDGACSALVDALLALYSELDPDAAIVRREPARRA